MEINDLRIFQTVAYEKSISKAALKLGYAQSNILEWDLMKMKDLLQLD